MVTSMEAIEFSELQRLGVPLDGEVLERRRTASHELDIQISDIAVENIIEDAKLGGTFVMIHALICNVSPRRIRLEQCRIDLPWDDPDFSLLEAPWLKQPGKFTYSPSRAPTYSFEREVVLNHRFGRQGGLNSGDSLDGFILGTGSQAIPDHYQQRQGVDVQLAIIDGRGNIFRESARVMLDRSEQLKRASAGNRRKRIPIFDHNLEMLEQGHALAKCAQTFASGGGTTRRFTVK